MGFNKYPGRCWKCGSAIAAGDGKLVSFRTGVKVQHPDKCPGVYSPPRSSYTDAYAGLYHSHYDGMSESDFAPDLGDK